MQYRSALWLAASTEGIMASKIQMTKKGLGTKGPKSLMIFSIFFTVPANIFLNWTVTPEDSTDVK